MKTDLIKFVTGNFNKVGTKFKKHSPEILIVTGVVGVVASAVMACKATTKVSEILDDAKVQIDSVHAVIENDQISEEMYSEEDGKKDLAIIYMQTGLKFIKLYGPSVLLGALSITSILASNNILRKRNVALAAAYTVVDTGFKEYRGRVIERFGKELDRELRYNIKAKKIEEVVVDEDGNEQVTESVVEVIENPVKTYSSYARFYDDGCKGWTKNAADNLVFLRQVQCMANERLRDNKHLFLNEVYDMLGIPRSQEGQVVGWVYNEKAPTGDNFVDFGMYDGHKEKSRDFVNGIERVILLDFNVDGNIWPYI